ncbi:MULTISPECIES: YidH family protein [Leptolyngbya]|jgi:hypothetical protein|uniref:hypothetical protein n=1 Tax=Leptolyngbya TaxID=47251 RepID=UPI000377D8F4|nr:MULTISPECIES: hypothetical protein [Leptolyngbya]MBD2372933.1 hypothetical protein [Leptolyngbya sp. FACHB-238]MBD2397314.1 hypothetical protein [Leptolyngbya sp. FACHB-239]MBD2403881.1 hypothetical protein [Leptolyngbya sp. FACHB-402]ULP33178.1 hypothetical protein MCP04_30885 [Leptolyngbya boryana IU 594]
MTGRSHFDQCQQDDAIPTGIFLARTSRALTANSELIGFGFALARFGLFLTQLNLSLT